MKRIENNQKIIVISKCLQMEVIRNAHDNDHFGVKKIKKNVKEYYMARLEKKSKDFISCCIPYIIANRKAGKKEGELLSPPKSSRSLSVYHIDHALGLLYVKHIDIF